MAAEKAATPLATYLLVAGAVLGLGAAMWSALGVNEAIGKYNDAIAIVDGMPIPRAVYDTAIEGLKGAKRNALTDGEKREALERIVDEELLLRRALALGLGESDPTSRKSLVNAMMQFSIADAAKLEPSDEELRAFYTERPKLIAPQPLLIVRAVSFDGAEADRIARFKAALDGGKDFEATAKSQGVELMMMPNGPIIPAKIGEYAGETIRDTALSLGKGETDGPVAVGRRAVFVHVIDRAETPPPPLEEVRDVVADEWRKRATEKAFADYVAELRSRARVSYAADAPKADTK